MKKCRKITSLLLIAALVLSLGMSSIALADTEKGTITITNAEEGITYTIYKILDLQGFDSTIKSYLYKASTDWKSFIESEGIKDVYLKTDANGYVTAVDGADFATFAKLAKEYAKENSITNQGQETADSTKKVEFTDLNLGYYLVDTNLGALCSLTTTTPKADVQEKNEGRPVTEKKVEEDSNPGQWTTSNDADFNQTVNFQTTITAKKGAENYVLHDIMGDGLTLNKSSITINGNAITVAQDGNTGVIKVKDSDPEEIIANVAFNKTHDGKTCTFEIAFTEAYLNKITTNTEIVVTYSAKLNTSANVGLTGNLNTTNLTYGDGEKTTDSTTTTYTYDMKVYKYTPGTESGTKIPLKDAKFVLLNSAKNQVAIIEDGKLTGWSADIPAEADASNPAKWPTNTVLTTGTDGYISITGLDKDTYYLREIVAPAGFNPLTTDKKVEIKGVYKDENDDNKLKYDTCTAEVENNKGTQLPSTGGVGTTIFYAVGSILVLGAGVLLVTRKRMSTK